jgi:hypothetical protein
LALNLIPTADDCSVDEAESKRLELEYKFFNSYVGSLRYLGMTRMDISYTVNKLAKHTPKPGEKPFEALNYFLRYLCNNSYLGLKCYSNIDSVPLTRMLPVYGFSDSS